MRLARTNITQCACGKGGRLGGGQRSRQRAEWESSDLQDYSGTTIMNHTPNTSPTIDQFGVTVKTISEKPLLLGIVYSLDSAEFFGASCRYPLVN